jgi:hypothetical protein
VTSDAEDWLTRLRTGEEHVVPGPLRRAMTFLLEAQNPGEGWGDYPNLPTDLQVTAQVIAALRTFRRSKADVAAANAAAWTHATHGSCDTADDLIALLSIAGTEGRAEGSYADRLGDDLGGRIATVSTGLLARALPAAGTARETARPWLDELLARQRGDGSWQSAGHAGSIPVTACAVRALAPWRSLPHVAKAADRGLAYLRAVLGERGWDSPALTTTYVLTLVIRALATGTSDSALVEEGLGRLREYQRPDGGWGGGPGEPSSAEQTAAAVIAFAESEAFRYVPLRTARQAVSELTASLADLARRHEALDSQIDARVEERAGRILADRDRLQRRLDDHRRTSDAPREQADAPTEAWSRIGGEILSWLRSEAFFFLLVSGSVVVSMAWAIPYVFRINSIVIRTVVIVVLALVAIFMLAVSGLGFVTGLKSSRSSLTGTEAGRLVDGFMRASERLSVGDRQDVAYELVKEGAELPADYARRLFQEWVYRNELDTAVAQDLLRWMDDYVSAGEETRKEFLSRLRKAVA